MMMMMLMTMDLNHINSKYYNVKHLNSAKIDLPSSFGFFHANIASLNKHIGDLRHILSLLSYKFVRIYLLQTTLQYLGTMNLFMNLLKLLMEVLVSI